MSLEEVEGKGTPSASVLRLRGPSCARTPRPRACYVAPVAGLRCRGRRDERRGAQQRNGFLDGEVGIKRQMVCELLSTYGVWRRSNGAAPRAKLPDGRFTHLIAEGLHVEAGLARERRIVITVRHGCRSCTRKPPFGSKVAAACG